MVVVLASCSKKSEPFTGDRGIFDLRGAVKSFVQSGYYGESNEYTFDEEGIWLTQNGQPLDQVYNDGMERDEQGRLVLGKFAEPNSCWMYSLAYVFNEDGSLASTKVESPENDVNTTYEYDDNGNCIKSHQVGTVCEMGFEEEEKIDVVSEYEVVKTDEHGNWTERKEKVDGQEFTIVREITYYE